MINIASILKSKEHVNIEVKSAGKGIPNSIWDTYSSFCNTFGGTIILGIAEDKVTKNFIPKGIENPQQMLSDIWNTLNNRQKVSANILLEHHVYPVDYNGMSFIVIEVPRADRRDKPIFIGHDMFKGTFRRNHEGDYHCSAEEVKSMLRDQTDTSQDALVLENLLISDLNQDSVHRYRILFNNLKPDHIWAKLGNEEFLLKIGAARKSQNDGKIHPTLGGLIFFGDFITITDELPNYFLDYREHLSSDIRWSDRVSSGDGTWSGNIFDFYYKVIDRLTADIKKPFKLDSNLLRVDDTSIHKSLRECLANALIHADFYGRRGIIVDKEFRKITISNPGTFRISIDEAIAGGISDARNGKIFNMFSLINVGERSGTGICDVYHVWDENGFKKPTFTETVNPERVVLTLQTEVDGNIDNTDGNSDGNPDGNLTQNEMLVLQVISQTPGLSAAKVGSHIGISKPSVERVLHSLKKKGIIRREGSTRGKWIILR
ncbi:MAG: putative DNA binding domain-containing protein [Lachnospiraceae bacterium]|nr:putative DNA binding domain-containing protein [Lachnospiraceae bacterium]